jgi:hypothetical protein
VVAVVVVVVGAVMVVMMVVIVIAMAMMMVMVDVIMSIMIGWNNSELRGKRGRQGLPEGTRAIHTTIIKDREFSTYAERRIRGNLRGSAIRKHHYFCCVYLEF